jgi:hypothetical protein
LYLKKLTISKDSELHETRTYKEALTTAAHIKELCLIFCLSREPAVVTYYLQKLIVISQPKEAEKTTMRSCHVR